MMKKNYKMTLVYDGTGYAGWQKQQNTNSTIQGILEALIGSYLKEEIELNGSGRTDKGVHALCQTVNFVTGQSVDCEEFYHYMNTMLPMDIRILGIEEVELGFHSRYWAKAKRYEYRIGLDGGSVFSRKYEYCPGEHLDLDRMKKAAQYLVGCHDFTGFSTKDGSKKSRIRQIYSIDFIKEEKSLKLSFYGNGFLYHMVRILSGTLMEVGMNRMEPEHVKEILLKKDRAEAGFTAPAHGLFLIGAEYDEFTSKVVCERLERNRKS